MKLNLQENGITFSYSNLKYNSKNEIVRISIKIKNEKEKASVSWDTGSEPISNIKVGLINNHLIASSSYNNSNEINYSYTIHNKEDQKYKGKTNKDGNFVFVTSDGEVNTWTSKNTDTIIHKNKIIIKEDDDEHVWVQKNDDNVKIEVIEINTDGKKTVKVIENNHEIDTEKEYNIEIIKEGDDASKNIFIIKKEGDKTVEISEDNASENVFMYPFIFIPLNLLWLM